MNRIVAIILTLLLSTPVVASDLPQGSLYSAPFIWKNQRGEEVTLASLKGHPVVLTFAYTRCTTACPMTMQRIKKVASALKNDAPLTQFVIVSLDPAHDTPQTLAKFMEQYKLRGPSWHLLTGSDAEVRKLSVLLNYSYQQQSDDDTIAHSNKMVALTKEGRVDGEVEGLDTELDQFIEKVKAIAERPSEM